MHAGPGWFRGGVGAREYDRVRELALALPEVTERLSHGAVCFFVQNRRPLCYLHDNHRGDRRVSLWCPLPAGTQDELVTADPLRFFRPTTSSRRAFEHWVGIFLDPADPAELDWDEIAAILADAYRLVAPAKLVRQLDAGAG